jgi:hypothetical protein
MKKENQADVEVMNEGTIFLFTPLTQEAKDWIESHVEDPMYYGNSLVVEHRYALDLAEGMVNDGLCVR